MKHTETPWVKVGLMVSINGRGIIAHCPTPQNGGVFECTANAEFIFEACNNYETLKAENAKLKGDVEKMGELLIKALDEYAFHEKQAIDRQQRTKQASYKHAQQTIHDVLQAAGITL
jgi:hypothetical protein